MSQIGDGVHEFVFVITVLHAARNNVALAGVVYFFRFIPYLVLGPLGGALSDRLPRRTLMIFADMSRAATTGLFCVLLVVDRVDLVLLGLIGMAMTAFRTLFQPAFQGTIPTMVSAEHLPAANGATQMAAETGALLGPALGGVVLATVGNPGFVLVIDTTTYLLSTLCIWFAIAVQARNDTSRSQEKLTIRNLYGDFGQNLQHALQTRALFITIGYSALCILFVGSALRILIPALLKGSGYSDSMVGYSMSCIAFGALTGAVACSKVIQRFDTRNLMRYWSLYGIALAILPACVASTPAIFAACFVLGGVGAFADIILPTTIQNLSTDANVGKNFSLFSTLANTGEALSGGLAGLLALISPVGGSLVITGLLIASVAYLGKIRVEG
ncbi:major Facilitator Superfamily protein [Burkholderia cenocepacia]|uniref:Major Facilitator Superfamily protein n=1 Tax=Burkholderia cenocepacia TaxID=95486 RepID=A0AAN0RMQ9_9BURK|nr:major Facilitator Superfamily protein [Burkholderia cenocepacia]